MLWPGRWHLAMFHFGAPKWKQMEARDEYLGNLTLCIAKMKSNMQETHQVNHQLVKQLIWNRKQR